MIITCYSCSTSFKLDDSLIKTKGTKVRCSRCKHFFILYPPEPEITQAPEKLPATVPAQDPLMAVEEQDVSDLPDLDLDESEFGHLDLAGFEHNIDLESDEEELFRGVIQEVPEGEDSLDGMQEPHMGENIPELELEMESLGIDLEDDDSPEEVSFDSLEFETVEPEMLEPMDLEPIEAEAELEPEPLEIEKPESDTIDFADVVAFEDDDPEFELEVQQPPAPPEPPPLPPMPVNETYEPEEERHEAVTGQAEIERPGQQVSDPSQTENSIGSKSKTPILIIVPLLLVVIIVGALTASLLTGFKIPFISDLKSPFAGDTIKQEKQRPVPTPSRQHLEGRFVENSSAGLLFVMSGKIMNPADIPYHHIKVKGSLVADGNKPPKIGYAYCGNIISEAELQSGDINKINAALSVKEGTQHSNADIAPGASIPFMIVFSGVSYDYNSANVQVESYE